MTNTFRHRKYLVVLAVLFLFLLAACDNGGKTKDPDPDPDPVVENVAPSISGATNRTIANGQTLDFLEGVTASDPEDGDLTSAITVDQGTFDSLVAGDYQIVYEVEDSEGLSATVTITVTVNEVEGPSAEEMIAADIAYYTDNQMLNPDRVNLLVTGGEYQSRISWSISSDYILASGLIIPLAVGEDPITVTYTGTFTIGDVSDTATFTVDVNPFDEVVLAESRVVPFENLTTEYDVADGELTLYFEEDGNVPYVDVESFFDLLEGFIDPQYDITFTEDGTTLTLFYQYYDEDEDYTYDLEVVIDAAANTVTTNDPGFYWAYVYSTETNYGRHIEYVENVDEHNYEGENIVFELDNYRMDIVQNDDGIFLPYFLVNQLFAGSSYYNVYYNYDGLYGIYSLPDSDSEEYTTIHTSSKNDTSVPSDVVLHNYDMLAFNLDYFYGLKDFYDVDTYYSLLETYESRLLSHSPKTIDTAIRDLLLLGLDEPHTSYGYPSYFNDDIYAGPATNSLAYYGPRFTGWYNDGLYAVDEVIEAKFGNTGTGWAAYSDSRPYYWFLDTAKTSGVLILDDFNTADINEANTYDITLVSDVLEVETSVTVLPVVAEGTKFFYYNNSTDDNRILEVLVKGVSAGYIDTYKAALVSAGFTLVTDANAEGDKVNGYYTKTIGEVEYMVQVNYDPDYELFYVGVADQLPETFDDEWLFTANVMDTVISDSAVYMEMILEKMASEAPNLENVVLDISWNTGGNVGALYRVVGFITDQPFRVSRMDAGTGSASSSFVQIEGVPYNSNLNWALLVSKVSFSAANSMTTIFKENNLGTIIGVHTGGGTASITPVLLPNGTAFTMSSNSLSALRLGTGTEQDPFVYEPNELGIEPDIIVSIEMLYDEATLLTAFQD